MPSKLNRVLFMVLAMQSLACGTAWPIWAADPIPVFVSIAPQQYIVQQIGAERVAVQVLVPPGADAHTYEPKPGQMAALTKTRLYFSIGISFEKVWLPRIAAASPGMKIVAADQGIEKMPMDHRGHDDAPGHHPGHDDETLDPHIWLSPPLIQTMAATIRTALAQSEPAQAARFEQNYQRFAQQLDDLDRQIRTLLADKQGTRFIAFHPSWGYFARTYGLIQIPIELEGKEPKPAQMRHLIQEAQEMKITVIFAQPQFSTRSAQVIAEAIGGRVVLADDLAADLPDNLLRQAQAFKSAVR
ncbi:MAG: zinc ABC transporter substrate-binding protein [Desulfatitalea sp.]